MLSAIARLVLITVAVLIVVFFSLIFVRWMGAQQAFMPPSHPWLDKAQWKIVALAKDEACHPIAPKPDLILFVEVVHKASEADWFVPCSQNAIPLTQLLRTTSHENWLLNVTSHADNRMLDKFIGDVSSFDKSMHFGIWARSQQNARYLRKQAPQWLFAADSGSLLRLHLFAGLWLETAFEFWPDFVIASLAEESRLTVREADELRRRKKRIVWDQRDAQAPAQPDFPVDGVLTGRPE